MGEDRGRGAVTKPGSATSCCLCAALCAVSKSREPFHFVHFCAFVFFRSHLCTHLVQDISVCNGVQSGQVVMNTGRVSEWDKGKGERSRCTCSVDPGRIRGGCEWNGKRSLVGSVTMDGSTGIMFLSWGFLFVFLGNFESSWLPTDRSPLHCRQGIFEASQKRSLITLLSSTPTSSQFSMCNWSVAFLWRGLLHFWSQIEMWLSQPIPYFPIAWNRMRARTWLPGRSWTQIKIRWKDVSFRISFFFLDQSRERNHRSDRLTPSLPGNGSDHYLLPPTVCTGTARIHKMFPVSSCPRSVTIAMRSPQILCETPPWFHHQGKTPLGVEWNLDKKKNKDELFMRPHDGNHGIFPPHSFCLLHLQKIR